ncbi:MAG: aldose 1-epimerase family protein [Firmicutes bacterium]|nr:aldose 1-epimerase family protein [Bacillota bacterium]
MNPYIGHDSQVYGIEEHRLVGGKGDGMRLLEIHNGIGLDLAVTPDRCGDIARLRYKGVNMSYMTPVGYVAPAFYDRTEDNFLKSFTAGFLTTCGLESAGAPSEDLGVQYPMHGSIANQPCEQLFWQEEGTDLVVSMTVKDERLFGRKLRLERRIVVSTAQNAFEIQDTVRNTGDRKEGFEILYHMNMGYPLLDEDSILTIPSVRVEPYTEFAAQGIGEWMKMIKPQAQIEEQCYRHIFGDGNGYARIAQPKLDTALTITFDAKELDGFTEWKMMGVRDYVLGLEPGNCYPGPRGWMRESGMLKVLEAGESQKYTVRVEIGSCTEEEKSR